jgi:hypothetical protein
LEKYEQARTVQLPNDNHGIDFMVLHLYLYDVRLALVKQAIIVCARGG